MKRIFLLLLLIAMVLPCFGLTVGAEESFVFVFGADTASNTLGGMSVNSSLKGNDPCLSKTYTAEAKFFEFGLRPEKMGLGTFDISSMKYVCFDIYTSRADALSDASLYFELSSSGTYDKQENGVHATIPALWGEELKNGWNKVSLPLSAFSCPTGDFDAKKVNFFRMFGNLTISEGQMVVVAVDNLGFSTVPTQEVASNAQKSENGRLLVTDGSISTGFGNGMTKNTTLRSGDACFSRTYQGALNGIAAVEFHLKTEIAGLGVFDISDMDTLTFDLYVSDADVLEDVPFVFEITSSGTYDKQENGTISTFAALTDSPLCDGWNTIEIPLSSLKAVAAGFDPTHFNYMRIYSNRAIGTVSALTVAVDNVAFIDSHYAVDAEETGGDEHEVVLSGCNKPFASFDVDTVRKTGGSAAWTCSMATAAIHRDALPAVNARGMDTLEFDLYLSSTDMRNADLGDAQIEISSSGVEDAQELNWSLSAVLKQNEWHVGWNHVALPLSTAARVGDFDISNVNFFGIYWTRGTGDARMTLKLDNIRLTDALAHPEAQRERMIARINALLPQLIELTESLDRYSYYLRLVEAMAELEELLPYADEALLGEMRAVIADAEQAKHLYESQSQSANGGADQPSTPSQPERIPDVAEPQPSQGTQDPNEATASVGAIKPIALLLLAAAAVSWGFVGVRALNKKKEQ